MSWTAKADWSYETKYAAGPSGDSHYESYAFRTWSNASYAITAKVLNLYAWKGTFTLGLFDVTPYKHVISWYRAAQAVKDFIVDFTDDNNSN